MRAQRILRIDRRFRGPPASGNGGYVAGLVAQSWGSTNCIVTLKKPPPLETDLRLECDVGGASLLYGGALIAVAGAAAVEVAVPDPPDLAAALKAQVGFRGFCEHSFPDCFVCGPERGEGDGLRIFPGPIAAASHQVAAIWEPDPSLDDGTGRVRQEFVWAALDCPGYFAVQERAGPAVLGRIGAMIYDTARVGEPVIVTGWPIASEGRKHEAGTALHDRSGRLLAAARATWISIHMP